MIGRLIETLSVFIVATISTLGYGGVVLLMAIESACIPLPSEIIMPFSGYLVYTGRFNIWLVSIAGAFGCVVGSLVAYWIGMYGGRPLIEKYGKYLLISRHDLDLADRWFDRFGEIIVFVSRLLPAIRTFIAFPAGVARMDLKKFVIYTFAGSLPWCLGLAYAGQKLGAQWDKDPRLKTLFHRFDFVIGIVIVAAIVWWIWRHLRHTSGKEQTVTTKAKG
ncbi:MAG TPA: DedA family protein [Pyrinomonadaceae bacterium]|jgi:membrane protein DedA with SNARE-associated domain|nr:DedA family protein [Pyrinomonadaceae bacterium]